jgi:aspartate/methionine/tyrosine aminotransferase
MKIEIFEMERMQSTWENRVEFNLSESGVHPMTTKELIEENAQTLKMLSEQGLGYPQSNGSEALRETIASMYPGATPDHIQVTNGTSEANFITTWSLIDDGVEAAVMLPNYMQVPGMVRNFGGIVKPFYLREENQWGPDLEQLRKSVNSKTALIAVCNPNNPTGAILSEEEMDEIVEIARSVNAWLLSDEVYQGAEREEGRAPSFWGRYERVIVTNGLSKAYGLPGLRIGWIVSQPEMIAKLWSYHDYTTIGPGMLSDVLAQIAIRSRDRIRQRTVAILRKNYPVLETWIREHKPLFTVIPPRAGAIAYMRYGIDINSTQLVEKLMHEKSTLIVPGDQFGMDHYLRIGYGTPAEYLKAGLDRIHAALLELQPA